MEIKEVCENCDNYNECHDGEDYSTDCDGGFVPRKDLVELQRKLRIAVAAIEEHKKTVYGTKVNLNEDLPHSVEYADEILWDTLEELR